MTCKICYAISIYGNFYSLCPAILVLLLSLFSCHGQKSSLSTASSFLTKDSSNGFLLFTDISTSSGARCKGIFNSLLSLSPPWIRPHSVGGAILWLSSSLREPPRPRPSCPAGIFLRSLCFLSQSKQLFHGGFQRSLVSSFQAALRLLVSLGCSFGCFSFLIFALFFFFFEVKYMSNVLGPTTWLHIIVLWSLLHSSSHKQLWNWNLYLIQERKCSCGCQDQLF